MIGTDANVRNAEKCAIRIMTLRLTWADAVKVCKICGKTQNRDKKEIESDKIVKRLDELNCPIKDRSAVSLHVNYVMTFKNGPVFIDAIKTQKTTFETVINVGTSGTGLVWIAFNNIVTALKNDALVALWSFFLCYRRRKNY